VIKMIEKIFVSRHPAALGWLKKHHPKLAKGCVHLTHATPDEVLSATVIGTLPIQLAALAAEYYHLMLNIPPELRGKELTVEDMERCGARLQQFLVKPIKSEEFELL